MYYTHLDGFFCKKACFLVSFAMINKFYPIFLDSLFTENLRIPSLINLYTGFIKIFGLGSSIS